MKRTLFLKFAAALMLLFTASEANAAAKKQFKVASPDGTIEVKISLDDVIRYDVLVDNEPLLTDCSLALQTRKAKLGARPMVKSAKAGSINTTIRPVVPLKFAEVKNHCNTLRLTMKGGYAVEFRVFDDGFAYRFSTTLKGEQDIMDELFTLHFPADYTAQWSPTGGFGTGCEARYEAKQTAQINSNDPMTYLPVLFQAPNGKSVLLSETNLTDYPGMFLKGTGENGLKALFPKVPTKVEIIWDRGSKITEETDYIARTQGTRAFPWRYFVVAKRDAQLVENTMNCRLSDPCELKDPSWIHPGQVMWDWWNHRRLFGVDFRSGVNTDTYKYFIDFSANFGVPYILIDEGWAKATTDPFTVIPEVDLPELIRYGKERGVKVMLWLPWPTVDKHMNLFKTYAEWGLAGVKIDFMDRQDQWMVNFYERVAKEGAKHHLLVDFHGAYKPSGLEQRYPNVMSYEGVLGMEQNERCVPDNSLYLPFIRNAVGAMDYTPGAMNSAQPDQCRSTDDNPQSPGTRAYQMALFVIFESGIQMLGESPSLYYREEPCARFITSVPVTWDETRVLHAQTGQCVAVAKRKGKRWYVGAITNNTPRDLHIALDFLDSGRNYSMQSFEDGANADRQAMDYKQRTTTVSATTRLDLKLVRNGGWCAVIE